MQDAYQAATQKFRWDAVTYRQNLPYLTQYLSVLLNQMGRVERKVATARYIEGLLMPGRGKFIRPLAERLGVDAQSLQQALTNGKWDPCAVWTTVRTHILPLMEPFPRWVIQERCWPKQGNVTVGVANQRCGAKGKSGHCQVSLELLGTDGADAAPLAARLYLPEEWTEDPERRQRSEIPPTLGYLSKPALALELIREAMRDGMRPSVVQGDSTYGNDREFRLALAQQNVEFYLEVDGDELYAWDFESDASQASGDLQPHTLTLNQIIRSLGNSDWRRCSCTNEAGMVRRTRIASREVFVDPGPFNLEGRLERLLLVVDWPEGTPAPYSIHLANFHHPRTEPQCLRLGRFHAYRDHFQNYFEDRLGLTSYQGRSWVGFHHHLALAVVAYLFVLILERRSVAQFWSELVSAVPIDTAIAAETHRLAGIFFRSRSSDVTGQTTVKAAQQFGD